MSCTQKNLHFNNTFKYLEFYLNIYGIGFNDGEVYAGTDCCLAF